MTTTANSVQVTAMNYPRFLFVLKHREAPYSGEKYSHGGFSSGLLNSARFVVSMLHGSGIHADLVQVFDNNGIDAEIAKHKSSHVVIEAFWVVPEKFDILKRLHPGVIFVVRNHSETPFMAQEGVAVDWTLGYLRRGVQVAPNSPSMHLDTLTLAEAHGILNPHDLVKLLPNSYPLDAVQKKTRLRQRFSDGLDVGCFGAIRPMKNQLQQALAAMRYAGPCNYQIRFHINGNRVEQGDNVLRNLRAAFRGSRHSLIEHAWVDHKDFIDLVGAMDINLCVSLSESFCIVAADSVALGIPTVGSPEIDWMVRKSKADPTDAVSIVNAMYDALEGFWSARLRKNNLAGLRAAVEDARRRWVGYTGCR